MELNRKNNSLVKKGVQKSLLTIPAFLGLVLGNTFFRIIYRFPFVHHQRKRFSKELKPLIRFKTIKPILILSIFWFILSIFIVNWSVDVLKECVHYLLFQLKYLFKENIIATFDSSVLSFGNIFHFGVYKTDPFLSIGLLLILNAISIKENIENFQRFRDFNHNEYGDDQFVTDDQLKREYKKVPDRAVKFKGHGGVPVAHFRSQNLAGWTLGTKMVFRNQILFKGLSWCEEQLNLLTKPAGYYLIEDDTVNALFTGMTRSGKDEEIINPMIDILSRAEEQSAMLIADPKGETYQSSYKMLRKRNINVQVLSYQNMDFSMSYNPLALAVEAAKKGYYEKTQERINAVAESIYRNPKAQQNGNSKYWEDSSISLFNAIAIALIDRANETKLVEDDAWKTITIRNITKFLTDLGSEEVLVNSNNEIVPNPRSNQPLTRKTKLTVYFDNLRKINQVRFSKFREMADINFRSSDFASEETKGNVYSSMMSGINLFLQDNVAKLTSENSVDLESLGFPRRISIPIHSTKEKDPRKNKFAYQTAQIEFLNQFGKVLIPKSASLIDSEGYLNFVIYPKLPDHFMIRVSFDHPNNQNELGIQNQQIEIVCNKQYKMNRLVRAKDPYSGKPIFERINMEMKRCSEQIFLTEEEIHFVYSDQVTALFLVTPPNRNEYNGLVSLLINQAFNINYETALNAGRKTAVRFQNIINEFGNIPFIPDMDQKLSIGLGQNILYSLFVQNLEQIDDKYGAKTAATIIGNCSLNTLIKTTSGDTAKKYSGLLGTRTITHRTKSSNGMKMTSDDRPVNVNTSQKEQELLTKNQLLKLQAGEMVTIRGVKAQDQSGRKVTTDPILVHGNTEMPYRYMFLMKEFDSSMTYSDIPVESKHRGLDLQMIAVESQTNLNHLINWRMDLEADPSSCLHSRFKEDLDICKELLDIPTESVSL